MLGEVKAEEREKLRMVGYAPEMPTSGALLIADYKVIHELRKEGKVEVMPTNKALEKYPWIEELLFSLVPREKDQYTKEASEKPLIGYFIRVLPGVKIKAPARTCFFIKTAGLSQFVHNIIIAEPESELHMITGCTLASYVTKGMHVGITEFFVKEGAFISFTMIHSWAHEFEVFPRTASYVAENATFLSNYIALTRAKKIQAYPVAKVKEGGIVRYCTMLYAGDGSDFDIGSAAVLEGKKSKAEIISRVVSDGGKIIARGRITGKDKDAKGHMECLGLLLKDTGMIHAIPELEGMNPEIELAHEAAVGRIASEEIEYLMARGIDEETAKALIIRGFLDVRIEGIPNELQNHIDWMIESTKLGSL